MADKLIRLPIEEARAAKWRRGREHYGPVFIGHPLEELDEELLDAMNYAEEAERWGFPMAGITDDLRRLCERARAVYGEGEGTLAEAAKTARKGDGEHATGLYDLSTRKAR